MAIWNDRTIIEYCNSSALVAPFDAALVNPASIDLRLDVSYRVPCTDGWSDEITMPEGGVLLGAGRFILCCTMETIAIPRDACAALFSKSSTGRIGLEHLQVGSTPDSWGN